MTQPPPPPHHPDPRNPYGGRTTTSSVAAVAFRGPAMFWPILAIGCLVMFGMAASVLLTGSWGVLVRGSGPIAQPVVVSGPSSAVGVPDIVWVRGGDVTQWKLDCTLPGHPDGRVDWNLALLGTESIVGPDGKTYLRGPEITWGQGEGNTMVCMSTSGVTHIVVGQEQTQTKVMKAGLFGVIGLGAAGLAALGRWQARRPQRAGYPGSAAG